MATDVVVVKQGVVGDDDQSGKSQGNDDRTVHNCCGSAVGPGYATPLDAMAGPRESLIYVTCVYTGTFLFSIIIMILIH